MDWETLGNMLLSIMILSVPVIFTVANVNYTPQKSQKREDIGSKEKARR